MSKQAALHGLLVQIESRFCIERCAEVVDVVVVPCSQLPSSASNEL